MHATETIATHECSLTLSADGQHIRSIAILVGPADQPGWRRKDEGSQDRRRQAKADVLAALADDPRAAWLLSQPDHKRAISVASRYTSLVERDGLIVRRDGDRAIGGYVE